MATYFKAHICNKISKLAKLNNIDEQFVAKNIKIKQPKTGRLMKLMLDVNDTKVASQIRDKWDGSDGANLDVSPTSPTTIEYTPEPLSFIKNVLSSVARQPDGWYRDGWMLSDIKKQTVIVDFSSPNIAKPFHVGHLRSTILGNFICKLHRNLGHRVVGINYLGDWGTQFGLLASGYKLYGDDTKFRENAIQHLYEVYVNSYADRKAKRNDMEKSAKEQFMLMEQGDSNALDVWKRFRNESVKSLEKTFQKLGIRFDEFHGESMYSQSSKRLLDELISKGHAKRQPDNSVTIPSIKWENGKEVVVGKSDGTTLYITRDVAAAVDRMERYGFDRMLYVVEQSQSLHFEHLRLLLDKLGHDWCKKIEHVTFGRIYGMSTRKGTAVFLDDVIDEAARKSRERRALSPNTRWSDDVPADAETELRLAKSAVFVNDLRIRRASDYVFSWDVVLQMKGLAGPVLQYAHARLHSLERNCGVVLDPDCRTEPLVEEEAFNLACQIAKYEEVVYEAYTSLEPSFIVSYLFDLSKAVNKAYKVLPIKGQPQEIAQARLLLFWAAKSVMANGLEVLGLEPLESM